MNSKNVATTLFFSILCVSVFCNVEHCDKDTCSGEFQYPPQVEWEDGDTSEMWTWLRGQLKREVFSFCKELTPPPSQSSTPLRLVVIEDKCSTELTPTSFNGKLGKSGLPEGTGVLKSMPSVQQAASLQGLCVKLLPGITSISGKFVKGLLQGRCSIQFDGGQVMEAYFKDGVIQGRVRLFNKEGKISLAGLYTNGLPHGPVWIFPWSFDNEGAVLVHYANGNLDPSHKVLYLENQKTAYIGTLVNSTFLKTVSKFKISKTVDINCLIVPNLLEIKKSKTLKSNVRLPVKIPSRALPDGKLFVRTSKTVFFNRIAKTGSQAFISMFYKLGELNNFKVKLDILQKELLLQPLEYVQETMLKVISSSEPSVWIRHYNFIDFERFGSPDGWSPEWFNFVRDPVERVISWFYYWRSAWNIVERKIQYPDEPLPDPAMLRKDFDTCVLEGDTECQFIQFSNVLEYSDHRSQMMAFCGHDLGCAAFNSPAVLQKAKENVERFYPVVGVLEQLNRSLAVMEDRMPYVFKGATQIYHTAKEVKKFRNRNAFKLPVSDHVMKLVRANFTQEIEFYEFCKQRLEKQFQEIVP